MPKGKEILSPPPASWENGNGSVLLLNPCMPAHWREKILAADFPELPGHFWLASSGTGGRLKIVALSRGAFEASARAVNAHLAATRGDVWINPLPLFHVGGLGIGVRAAMSGSHWENSGPWNPAEFGARAHAIGATLTSLVPAQVHDLVRAGIPAPPGLRAAVVGGGALAGDLLAAGGRFGWPLLPSYGLTEAASQVATTALGAGASPQFANQRSAGVPPASWGKRAGRPRSFPPAALQISETCPGATDSAWLPVLSHIEARTTPGGILELRGASLLTGWMIFDADGPARWEDPKTDGWLRTSDRAEICGRDLRLLGRVDDLVKIRGELVDLVALERALQSRVSSGLVRIDIRPDARNGFILHVVAENPTAADETRTAFDVFPPFARPASVETGPIPRTALGKIARAPRSP